MMRLSQKNSGRCLCNAVNAEFDITRYARANPGNACNELISGEDVNRNSI